MVRIVERRVGFCYYYYMQNEPGCQSFLQLFLLFCIIHGTLWYFTALYGTIYAISFDTLPDMIIPSL